MLPANRFFAIFIVIHLLISRSLEYFHCSLRGTARTGGVGAGGHPARRNRVVVKRTHRRAVIRSNSADRLDHSENLVRLEFFEDSKDHLALERKSRDRLTFDDRLTSLGIDHSRQQDWSMTHRSNNASASPNISGDGLQSASTRIVIECGMSGRGEEEPVLFFLQVGRFLELQIQLDVEWMLGVVENGLVTP